MELLYGCEDAAESTQAQTILLINLQPTNPNPANYLFSCSDSSSFFQKRVDRKVIIPFISPSLNNFRPNATRKEKWETFERHFIKNNCNRPQIDFGFVESIFRDWHALDRWIRQSASHNIFSIELICDLGWFSKINDFQECAIGLVIHQNIFRFQIPMHNSWLVHNFYCSNKLFSKVNHLLNGEIFFVNVIL